MDLKHKDRTKRSEIKLRTRTQQNISPWADGIMKMAINKNLTPLMY